MDQTLTRGTVRVAGSPIAYETRGRGPALLLLHAFPLGAAMWDAQVEAFSASHQVVRFDCRGFGASPPGSAALTMERIADDAAALLDHLGLASAIVCGCSMGGYAAFAMLRRHAPRLRGLVLVDTRAGADSEEARQHRARLAERVLREGALAAVEAFLPKLAGETTHRERPHVVARLREMILANPPRGIADALAGLAARPDFRDTLREVRVPTLVVCGSEDVLTPPAEAQAMHLAIAGSRLHIIARVGHLASAEDPAAFNDVLHEFTSALD